jgi:hypothetical protein
MVNKTKEMSKQKQSKADLQDKKIQALINVVQRMLDENAYVKDLAVGTLETIKLMDGYDKALEDLKNNLENEPSKEQEKKLEL